MLDGENSDRPISLLMDIRLDTEVQGLLKVYIYLVVCYITCN